MVNKDDSETVQNNFINDKHIFDFAAIISDVIYRIH